MPYILDDEFINKTIIGPRIVERCYPNPCLNNGHCIDEDRNRVCNCSGHFTGKYKQEK